MSHLYKINLWLWKQNYLAQKQVYANVVCILSSVEFVHKERV